jgi:hypothetical protein
MDLLAGQATEMLLALGLDDLAALDDRRRIAAHVALGGGLDPTWLDLFAEAVRRVTGADGPGSFLDATFELDSPNAGSNRTIERVDPAWIDAVARVQDREISPIAAGWIDLIEEDLGPLPGDEKPWIRDLTGQLVAFCRAADRQPDVLFAWSLQ